MRQYNYSGYLFIAPIVIFFLIFIAYPILFNVFISFHEWNGIDIERMFTGFLNYRKLFTDPVLLIILRNFVIFATLTISVQAFLGMIFANYFFRSLNLSGLYRTLIYLPVVATPAIIGSIFSKILETNLGDMNTLLRSSGLGFLAQQWLALPHWALVSITGINIWQWTGYSMLLYYANMLNIPEDVYEAATIDGAGQVQQFFRISFPMLRSAHFTLVILGTLGSLKCFDLPYILTKGGPNHATEFFSTYMYQKSFEFFDQGGSSALVILMFMIALVITAVQMKLYNKNEREKA
jgi:raffinose/stachyose/melibiose transport system permease protein